MAIRLRLRGVVLAGLLVVGSGCSGGGDMAGAAMGDLGHADMLRAAPDLAQPDMACASTCTPDATRCASDGTLVTCTLGANGCASFPAGGGLACGARQTCRTGASTCSCDTDSKCTAGAGRYCTTDPANGNAPATYGCAADADGCIVSSATLADCGAHQSCTGSAGSASCTCDSDPTCSSVGTFCPTSTSYATCATDAQSCVYDAGTTSCVGKLVCSGGSGSATCSCPAVGTADGSGCATPGDAICSAGGDVLTCQTSGGCNLWVTTAACSTASLDCTASGNSASCVCPTPNPSNILYVDPTVTPITVGGVAVSQNGAQSPIGCRFSTLGAGLAAAVATASSANLMSVRLTSANPLTITSESWPLTVPPNVTLDSDDGASPPTKYTLSPGAGEQAVAVEGGGTFADYVVNANLTGANSPPALSVESCTASDSTPVIDNVALDFSGTATGDGIDVADATTGYQGCAPRISSVTIDHAYNGIVVSSASGAASSTIGASIQETTIDDSGNAGLLVYQTGSSGVTVSSSTVSASKAKNVWLDTATLVAHTGTVSITGSPGSTTIANSQSNAYGIVVDNSASGQAQSGAVLNFTDVTVVGLVDIAGGHYSGDALHLTNATATLSAYTSQTSGASRGLYAAASNVTMQDDGSGNHCSITGAADSNAGMRIDSGTTLTATNADIESNDTWGANISNSTSGGSGSTTTVTLNGCTFKNQANAGGVQVAGTDALNTVSLTVVGGSFDGNKAQGFHIGSYATANLTGGFSASNNGSNGILVDGTGASLTVGNPMGSSPNISGNASDGIAQSAGSANVHGSSSSGVYANIQNNGGDGINFTGGTFTASYLDIEKNAGNGVRVKNPATGTFVLSNSRVSDHTASGILVDNANPSAQSVTIESVTVNAKNVTPSASSYGLEIDASAVPAASGVFSTWVEDGSFDNNNIGIGIGAGSASAVSVNVLGNEIDYNRGAGAIYSSSSATNALSFVSNSLVENGTTGVGSGSAGGIGLSGTPPLFQYFDENDVGNNAGNQLYVYYADGGGATWDFTGGANAFLECATSGATSGDALFAECTSGTLTVKADGERWYTSDFPGSNLGTGGAGTTTVTTTNAGTFATCPTE